MYDREKRCDSCVVPTLFKCIRLISEEPIINICGINLLAFISGTVIKMTLSVCDVDTRIEIAVPRQTYDNLRGWNAEF